MIGNNLNSTSDDKNPSMFTSREKWFLIPVLAIAAYFIVPHLDTFTFHLQNALAQGWTAMWYLGGFAAVIVLFMSKRFRYALGMGYRLIIRYTIGQIVAMDPEGILYETIDEAKADLRNIEKEINNAQAAKENLERKIRENNSNSEKELKMAAQAKKMSEKTADPVEQADFIAQAGIMAKRAAGLQDMNTRLIPLRNSLDRVVIFMEKAYKSSDFMIKEMELNIEMKTEEYKAVKAGHKALSSAMRIFKGDPEKQMMYDNALKYINDDMSHKISEMKRVIKTSKDIMASVDISDAANTEQGIQLLEKFEKGEMKLLSYNSVNNLTNANTAQPITIQLPNGNSASKGSDTFAGLLD